MGFGSSVEVKHDNSIDYNNNVLSNEKVIEKDSDFLHILRVKNVNRLIIGNLNINSTSNKFDQLKLFGQGGKVDILIVTETELDSTFPTSQFVIHGYIEPYRFDRNRNRGRVLIYMREDIPNKLLADHKLPHDIEGIFVELNLSKKRWLLFGSYLLPSQSYQNFFHQVKKGLDMYSKFYERYMLIGDFNAEESEPCISQFLFEMNAKNIVKETICYKILSNPSCIDLVITSSSSSFQNTMAISTGLSDFHKMVITILKQTFQRCSPKELVCRDYKNFNIFRTTEYACTNKKEIA